MKNTIVYFLFCLVAFSSIYSDAYAAVNPIPGVDIVVRKRPPRNTIPTQTDANGRFTYKLEAGEYELAVPGDILKKILKRLGGRSIMLVFDTNKQITITVGGKRVQEVTLSEESNPVVVITIPPGGATIGGVVSK
jgi:hypothetical protein